MHKLNMYKTIKKLQAGGSSDFINGSLNKIKNPFISDYKPMVHDLESLKNPLELNTQSSVQKGSQIDSNLFKAKIPEASNWNKNLSSIKSGIKTFGTVGSGIVTSDIGKKVGAGIDAFATNAGHEENAFDAGLKTGGEALLKSGNPYAQAAGVAALGMQKVGELSTDKVEGFEGNTGISGFTNFSKEGKSFSQASDYLLPGSGMFRTNNRAKDYAKEVNDQMRKYATAQSIVNNQKNELLGARQGQDDFNVNVAKQLTNQTSSGRAKSMFAKNGGQIVESEIVDVIFETKEDLELLKQGGSVIPSGALHANKNNLKHEELDGNITNKGIPVISRDGNGIKQHAEVEKNEIILSLEITKKLQDLKEKNTKESMIEAGKLLAKEIMTNTEDNTGIIKEILKDENKNK